MTRIRTSTERDSYQWLFLLIIVFLIMCLLTSCAGKRVEVVATFSAWPMMVMPNETVLAWSDPTVGAVSEVYSISLNTGIQKHLGKLQTRAGMALDNDRWIVDSDANGNPEISIYDLTTKSSRLLLKHANLERISGPVSPNKKNLLVKKNGVCVVDIASGKEIVLLSDVIVLHAQWSPDGKSVVACYQQPNEKSSLVEQIEFPSKKRRLLTAAQARHYYPEITDSPNRKYIAYQRSGKVICESLGDGRKWVVADLSPDSKYPKLSFSRDSERLAVSVFSNGNMNTDMSVFDTTTKKVSTTHFDLCIARVNGWDWLSDNRTIYMLVMSESQRGWEIWRMHPAPGQPARAYK